MSSHRQGPLRAEVFRGDQLESFHNITAVVVNAEGHVVQTYGEESSLVFPRSAIKLIQALSLMESGAAAAMGLSDRQVALACASHLGEPIHTDAVRAWLEQMRLPETALECGAHEPFDDSTRRQLSREGLSPSPVHNNCSGKHCGMLGTALHLKLNPKGYSQYDHPVQVRLREILGELGACSYDRAPWGTDGCGIPTYAIPLQTMALSMSALLPDAKPIIGKLSVTRREAAKRILRAIQHEPLMISGNEGLCSQVVRLSGGRVIAKTGAEGVYAALLPEKGLSIALKVHDGSTRASELAILSLVHQYGGLTAEQLETLSPYTDAVLKNWAGKIVGKIQIQPT